MRAVLLCLLLACAAPGAPAQPPGPGAGKGPPVLTLYMKTIGGLEQQLAQAEAGGDVAGLDRLLSPFFEWRRPRQEALARTHVMAASRERSVHPAPSTLSELSVYEVGAEAVAYFLLRDAQGHVSSVVDVWTRAGGTEWKLRLRFEQPLPPP